MISHITQAFRTAFTQLPVQVQQQAREAYKIFRQNPYHPSLRWKHVHPTKPIYSVRVGRGYRAVGIHSADEVIWFWIGSHAAMISCFLGCSPLGVPSSLAPHRSWESYFYSNGDERCPE